jgi:hypothetical protein
MKLLTRDQILEYNDIKTQVVQVPEWGGEVIVKGLTAGERDKWEASLYTAKQHGKNIEIVSNRDNLRAKFVAVSVVDEKGKPLFTAGDIEALTKKSAAPMDRIFTVAQKLSGMSDNDVEELEKNLNGDHKDISTTN